MVGQVDLAEPLSGSKASGLLVWAQKSLDFPARCFSFVDQKSSLYPPSTIHAAQCVSR